jgi:protein TonB
VRDAARALGAGLSLEVDRSLARLAGVWRPMLSTAAAMGADGAAPRAAAPSATSSHDDAIQPAASRHAPANARASVEAASEAAHSERRAATSADPSPRTTAATAPESESRSDPDTTPDSTPAANANASASAEAPVDASVLDASVLELATPAYPRRAARLGQEGTARVEIALSAEGEVIEIRILESSGHRLLDEAAIRAARAGRYRPATRDGRAIASVLVVPFEFRVPR